MSVIDDVMISLPGASWREPRAMCTEAVPLEQAMQCLRPTYRIQLHLLVEQFGVFEYHQACYGSFFSECT
jgi:hypothetical protein